jgi:threonine synthase
MVQSSYYVWACLQIRPMADGPVDFVVPTGAFGNAVGGLLAKRMGCAIGTIVCATNANDVVHRTISAGDLSVGRNVATVSPAMDIQYAYNVERMLYLVSGGDAPTTARIMTAAQSRRAQRLPRALLDAVQAAFLSVAISDEETCMQMAATHASAGGYTLDPHSAVGVRAASMPTVREALKQRAGGGAHPVVCVLTAHPAKFEDACARAGIPPVRVPAIEALRSRPRSFSWLRAPKDGAPKLAAWAAQLKAAVEAAAAKRQTVAPRSRL